MGDHWVTLQMEPFTVTTLGMKLGVDDEMMRPKPISGPPAMRLCQLWVTTPVKVPAERLVSCVHIHRGGESGEGAGQHRVNTTEVGEVQSAACMHTGEEGAARTAVRVTLVAVHGAA